MLLLGLILNIQSELYKIARMRLYNEDDINEAVQETMIEAFKGINKLKYNQYFKNNIENQISNDEIKSDVDFYILISKLEYEERMIVTLYYLER